MPKEPPRIIMEKSKDVKRRFQRSKPFRFSKEQIARLDREEARERRAKELREKEKQRVANKKKKAEAEALAREEQRRRGIPVPTTRYGPSSQPLLLPFFKKGGQASLDHQRALVAEPDLAQPKGDTSTDRTGLGGDPVWDSLDRRIGEPDRDRATRGAAASDAVVISSDEIINGSECSGQGVQGQSSTVYAEPDPEPPSGVRPETVPAWGIAPVFPWNTSTPYSSSLPAPGDLLAYHGEAHCGGAVDDTVEGSTEYGSSPPVLADWDDLGFGGQGSENQAKTGRQAICASTQRGLSPVMPAQSPSFESSQFEPADFFDAEASCGNPGEIGGHAISASTRCGLPPVSPVQGHYVRSSQFNPADLFDIKANCGEPVGIGGQAISASTQRGLSPGSPAQGHYIRSSQFNPDNFSDSGDKVGSRDQAISASTQYGLSPVAQRLTQSPSFGSSQLDPVDFFDAEARILMEIGSGEGGYVSHNTILPSVGVIGTGQVAPIISQMSSDGSFFDGTTDIIEEAFRRTGGGCFEAILGDI